MNKAAQSLSPSTNTETIDYELVTRAKAGDIDAFGRLVQRYRPACLRKARAILRNGEDAEDEVQNAILLAFVHLPEFEFRSSFSGWLIRIVSNRCLMSLRRGRILRMSSVDEVKPESTGRALSLQIRSGTPNPEEILHRKQLASVIEGKSRKLPSTFRKVLADYRCCPRSTYVTDRLEISLSAAKSRLHRARRELRCLVEPQFQTIYSVSQFRLPPLAS